MTKGFFLIENRYRKHFLDSHYHREKPFASIYFVSNFKILKSKSSKKGVRFDIIIHYN